jgi:hypothetical protein
MIENVWAILCSNSVIDQETNNISLHNVIDQITVNAEPIPNGILPITFDIVSSWIRKYDDQPTEGTSRFTFRHPSGKIIILNELPIDLRNNLRARQRIHLNNLLLEEAGRHIFLVELKDSTSNNWKEVATIPLTVIFNPIQQKQVKQKKLIRKATKRG